MSGAKILRPLCVFMTYRGTTRLPKLRLFFKFLCALNIVGHWLEVLTSVEVSDSNPDPKACPNSVCYALIITRRCAVWATYTHLLYPGTFTDHLATLALNQIVQRRMLGRLENHLKHDSSSTAIPITASGDNASHLYSEIPGSNMCWSTDSSNSYFFVIFLSVSRQIMG
jgi:hypothetical protein